MSVTPLRADIETPGPALPEERVPGTDAVERRIASVAHEIRSPLNGLIALADTLLGSELTEDQRQLAEGIRAAARHLFAVSRDMLDTARLNDESLRLEPAPFLFDDLMSAIGAAFAARAARKGIKFDIDCAPDIPETLLGDATRLRQMIENLIDNSLKVTDRGGIKLAVTATPGASRERIRLNVTVTDTGPGLAADETESIFRPYQQGAHARGGVGLGLSLVRGLAEAMGGKAFAANREGGGAAVGFTVLLNRTVTKVEVPQASPPPRPVGALKILVVEDNPINRVVIGTILDQFGHNHDMVTDGAAAIATMSRQRYDLVLMDRNMPNMDGLAATRAIRVLPDEHATTPVIGVTAGAFPHEIEEFKAAGANAVVTKPISVRALWAAIDDAFKGDPTA